MPINSNKNEFGSVVDFTRNNSGFDLLKYMVKQARTKDTSKGTGPYVAKVLRVTKVDSEDLDVDWLTQAHNNQNAVDQNKSTKPVNPLDFKNRIIIYGRITNEVIPEQFNMHGMLPDPGVFGSVQDTEENPAIENIIRLHSRFVAISDTLETPSPGDYVWVNFLNKDDLNQGIYISNYKAGAQGQITCDITCATDAFKKSIPTGSFSKSTNITNNDPERFKREQGSFSFSTKQKGIEIPTEDEAPPPPPEKNPPTEPSKKPFPATQPEPQPPSEPENQPPPSDTVPPQDAAEGAPTAKSKNVNKKSPQTKKKPPPTPSCTKTETENTSLNKSANTAAETTKSTSQILPTWLFDGLSYETNFGFEDKRVRYRRTSIIKDNQYLMFVLHEPAANNTSGFSYAEGKINNVKKASKFMPPTKANKGKVTDAMHFYLGAAGEVFQIQSLKNKSSHANVVNNFSTGVETVGQVWYLPYQSEKCFNDAKNNVFIVGDITTCLTKADKSYKNNKHHFLGSDVAEKVKKQRKEILAANKKRITSQPMKDIKRSFIHKMTRSMPNEVSFRRTYELWVYLCSEDNPDKNLFHNGFRQKKTAACINDPEGHGTGFMRQDVYLNESLTPQNAASAPKVFVWGQKLLTNGPAYQTVVKKDKDGDPVLKKTKKLDKEGNPIYKKVTQEILRGGAPGYPSVQNSRWKKHWNADRYGTKFRNGRIDGSQIIEKEHWFQGVVSHCFWGGSHRHVDGWNILYYFLCRWLGMTSEDAFFATIGAYMTVRIGGVLEGISAIPSSQRLLPGYVYYPNHPGANYVEIGKQMFRESKFYEDGYYNLNPHIKGNSKSSLQEDGASGPTYQTDTGKMAAFPRSVIFESDTRYPKQEGSGLT